MKVTTCPKCGGPVKAESIGLICENCGGLIDMMGKYYPAKKQPSAPPATMGDAIRAQNNEQLARDLSAAIINFMQKLLEKLGVPFAEEERLQLIEETAAQMLVELNKPAADYLEDAHD